MPYIILALGSNIGNKEENIEKAYDELNRIGIETVAKSSVHITPAYGVTDQADFANSVILGKTDFSPEELLKKLKETEILLGRYKTFRWGPRVIDIDIIFYDNILYESDTLIIPHKDYKNRSFVLNPMEEIKDQILNTNLHIFKSEI